MKKIGLLIQIANFHIWNKIKIYISKFHQNKILMLHINSDMVSEEHTNEIKKNYPNAIYTFGKNKGMDIYGFFIQIKYIIENQIHLDYICKIHTKSKDKWRDDLIIPIINVNKCIDIFEDESIGMICCKKYFRLMDHYNTPIILQLLKLWNIENNFIDEINWKEKYDNIYDLDKFNPEFYITYPYNRIPYDNNILQNNDKLKSYAIFHWLQIGYKVFKLIPYPELITKKNNDHKKFCAGTIFWIRAPILINFFKKYINIDDYSNNFEDGYFLNDEPTFTHSLTLTLTLTLHLLRGLSR